LLLGAGVLIVRLGMRRDPLDALGSVETYREVRPTSTRERD
jgi:hypothetical protein